MTEIAEYKLITDFLNQKLKNNIITDWKFLNNQKSKPRGFEKFKKLLPFLIEDVFCKGKIIVITCYNENGRCYILHSIRANGRWQDFEDEECNWYVEINGLQKIWFHNTSSMALLHFTMNESTMTNIIGKLGPDILSREFDLYVWKELIANHKNKNVTSFLMDQCIISGCGNYTKCEVLYYACISPLRKIGSLNETEIEKLFEGLRIIPRIAYNNRGYDYINPQGRRGFHELYVMVYKKPTATITRTADGFATYWEPKIQK